MYDRKYGRHIPLFWHFGFGSSTPLQGGPRYRVIPLESLASITRSSITSPFTISLWIAPFNPVVIPESRFKEYAYLQWGKNEWCRGIHDCIKYDKIKFVKVEAQIHSTLRQLLVLTEILLNIKMCQGSILLVAQVNFQKLWAPHLLEGCHVDHFL